MAVQHRCDHISGADNNENKGAVAALSCPVDNSMLYKASFAVRL